MKKRLFAFLLCALVLVPTLLMGCSSDKGNSGVKSFSEAKNGVVVVQETIDTSNVDGKIYYSRGSGFFIGTPGEDPQYLMTNHHVVENFIKLDSGKKYEMEDDEGNKITVLSSNVRVYFDSEDYVNAYVVAYDEPRDLALLRIEKPTDKRVPLIIEEPTEEMVGDRVYAVGYPGLADTEIDPTSKWGLSDVSLTSGIVSRLVTIEGTVVRRIQTDTDIWHGNSGGPMVNEAGRVVGISTRYESADDGNRVESTQYGVSAVEIVELLDKNNIKYEKYDPNNNNLPFIILVSVIGGLVLIAAIAIIIVLSRRPKVAGPEVPVIVDPPRIDQTPLLQPAKGDDSGFRVQGTSGVLNGKRIYISISQPLVIGRDRDSCNMTVPEGTPGVSRQHCALSVKNGKLYIEDLGSSHGTFIAPGRKLTAREPIELHAGDTFYIGSPKESFVIDMKRG